VPSLPVTAPVSQIETGVVTETLTTRDAAVAQEYVGIDLHRRSSVIYRMDQAGKKIDWG
jgi:hypothetical protein